MTAHLKLVSQEVLAEAEKRTDALKAARDEMRTRVSKLTTGKSGSSARNLLAAIDTLNSSESDPTALLKASRTVKHRLVMLKQVRGERLSSEQERDATVVMLFVTSATKEVGEERKQACALIALKGSDAAKAKICGLFPGFSQVFSD